jgi:hypothetical protein
LETRRLISDAIECRLRERSDPERPLVARIVGRSRGRALQRGVASQKGLQC